MKPHIKKVNGLWWCNTELQVPISGVTPDNAYRNWKLKNIAHRMKAFPVLLPTDSYIGRGRAV